MKFPKIKLPKFKKPEFKKPTVDGVLKTVQYGLYVYIVLRIVYCAYHWVVEKLGLGPDKA